MSQNFHTPFDSAEVVQTTMEHLIEESLDALRTNWEGTAAPTIKASQFWSDLSESKLKIMNQGSSTEWLDVYDFTAKEIVLSPNQVGTTEISGTARKGTIVTGENINPNTCTLQAKFKTVSLFSTPCQLFPQYTSPTEDTGLGCIGNPGGQWYTLLTSKIYVPDDAGTLSMQFRQITCTARFAVGGSLSTTTGGITGPAWGPTVFLDLSSFSGWYDIEVQGISSSGSPPYGGISGVAALWEN